MSLTEQKYSCQNTDRQEIHKALEKEYETVSKASFEQTVKLTNGLFQQTLGNKHIYRFELPKEPEKQLEPDKPYGLRIDRAQVRGGIYALTEYSIEIELNENYGRHIPLIEVIIDLTILIDLVDKTIVSTDKEPEKFEIHSIQNLLYPKLAETSHQCRINHQNRLDDISLNQNQSLAIENSLKRNLNIIWGPPGTGKTKTLQGVIAELLIRGKKILFASNTNNAIDGLLEDFVHNPPYEIINDLKHEDKIVRVGSQSNEIVKSVFSPNAISEKNSKALNKEIEKLQGEINDNNEEINKLNQKLLRYQKYQKIKDEILKLNTLLNDFPTQKDLLDQLQLFESCYKTFQWLIQYWNDSLKDEVEKLEQNSELLNTILQQKYGLSIRITQTENDLKKVRQIRNEISREIKSLRNNIVKRLFSIDKIRALEERFSEITTKADLLKRNNESEIVQFNQITIKEAQILSSISSSVNSISTQLSKTEFTLYAKTLENFDLIGSFKQEYLKDLSKLKDGYDFISDNFLDQINFVLQLVSTTDVEQKLAVEKNNLTQKIYSFDQRKDKIRVKIQNCEEELDELSDVTSFPTSHWESIKSNIASFQSVIKELEKKAQDLKNQITALSSKIIKEAQLLCSTLVKASYDELILDSRFDVLIVDEISMVSIPQLYCAVALTKEQIIFCGDHLQLQPICQSKSDLAVKWLASSYFGLIEGYENLKKRNYKFKLLAPFLSILSEQRRMPVEISEIIKTWYQNAGNDIIDKYTKSQDIKNVFNSLGNHFLSSDNDIYILDTKKLNTYHNRTADKSPYNFMNAVIVAELLRELIEEKHFPPEKILCVSPYKAQYQLTWAIFNKLLQNEINVSRSLISSVHKTQGREAEIIIYDLTEGTQKNVTGFIKTSEFFIHNVAISRSRAKIIFVGDTEKLERIEQQFPDAAFNLVYKKIKSNAKRIDAKPYKEKVLKVYSLNELLNENILSTDDLNNKLAIVPSILYYKLLEQDILNAKENIVIISPFITLNRWNKLGPIIKALLKNNPELKIEVLAKPPDKMFGNNGQLNMAAVKVLNEFLELGFKVRVSEKIHSKLIVIDRGTEKTISYWGSLNPLSFNNTDEINTRLCDKEIAEQLINMSMVGKIKLYQGHQFINSKLHDHLKEAVRSELNQLKWTLAGFYHCPIMLFRKRTFEYIIENLPCTDDEFRAVPDIKSPKNILFKHLDQIRQILKPLYRYKKNKPPPTQQNLFN